MIGVETQQTAQRYFRFLLIERDRNDKRRHHTDLRYHNLLKLKQFCANQLKFQKISLQHITNGVIFLCVFF